MTSIICLEEVTYDDLSVHTEVKNVLHLFQLEVRVTTTYEDFWNKVYIGEHSFFFSSHY